MGVSGSGSGGGGGAGEGNPLSSHHGPGGSTFPLLVFHFLSWYDVTVTAIQSTRSDSFKSVLFIKEKIFNGFSENTRNNHQKIKKTKKISKSAQKSYIVSVRLDLLQAENFSVANPANMSKPERVFFCFFSVMFLLH